MKTSKAILVCSAALSTMTALTSCLHQDDIKISLSDRPDYLQDSERWGRVVVDTLANVNDVQVIKHEDANADIYYEQAAETRVVVEANEKVRKDHSVSVKGTTLIVKSAKQDQSISSMRPSIVVRVYSPAIHSIIMTGSGDVKVKKPLSLPTGLKIDNTGTGDVELHDLTCKGYLKVEVSGTSDVEMETVQASSARITTQGTGDIDIESLTCTGDVKIVSSGTGDVSMRVACQNLVAATVGTGDVNLDVDCNQVEASATGTGDLELKGKAKRLIKEENGLGNIRSKKLEVKAVEY